MIDLTRRNFIKNVGFVGATTLFCGSLLAQNTFDNFSDSKNGGNNILSHFSKSSFSDTFLLNPSLLDCYNNAIVNWEKTGYVSSGNYCYSSIDGHLKMFPMHLHTDSTGKIDDVLLCFGKNSNGEWKSLRSLSGFDIEALTVALKDLNIYSNEVNLFDYLFPAPLQQFNPYGFNTKKGSVSLQTLLAQEQTSTKIIIKEGSNIVYQKEVISQHRFVANSLLV